VRLWDMYTAAPLLLGHAPTREASSVLTARAVPRPVSTLEFAWEQGLLITGHEGGEVRVYQFAEHSRTTEVVHFESVGGAANNDTTPLKEPPGFQLRLQSLVHSADICTSAYHPSFKFVAVSDKAGTVSLIDLSKPAILWLQAPMKVPVVSLALARCPLPPRRERSGLVASSGAPGAGPPAPGGAYVNCVVAVAADSSVGVLDAATGFFLSRRVCAGRHSLLYLLHCAESTQPLGQKVRLSFTPPINHTHRCDRAGRLKPKHPSNALLVEPLDKCGAPVWMARDVGDLVELCR